MLGLASDRSHSTARRRLRTLCRNDQAFLVKPTVHCETVTPNTSLQIFFHEAGVKISSPVFFLGTIAALTSIAAVLSLVLTIPLAVLFTGATVWCIWSYLDRARYRRAQRFNEEFPNVLQTMASGLRVGLTPIVALERSVLALSPKSLVRGEAVALLDSLRCGVSLEQALTQFGSAVALPELPLFRRSFALALRHGGRFTPTLERLAEIGRERATLIRAAEVSTTSMRLTANVLLAMCPFVLLLLSLRRPSFWSTALGHPVSSAAMVFGALLLTLSYMLLQTMSRFRP